MAEKGEGAGGTVKVHDGASPRRRRTSFLGPRTGTVSLRRRNRLATAERKSSLGASSDLVPRKSARTPARDSRLLALAARYRGLAIEGRRIGAEPTREDWIGVPVRGRHLRGGRTNGLCLIGLIKAPAGRAPGAWNRHVGKRPFQDHSQRPFGRLDRHRHTLGISGRVAWRTYAATGTE